VVWVRIAAPPERGTGCHPVRVPRERMIGGRLIKFTGRGRGSRGRPCKVGVRSEPYRTKWYLAKAEAASLADERAKITIRRAANIPGGTDVRFEAD
jgi:hypothetical protein